MRENHSPWLSQLDSERSIATLNKDLEAPLVIIGAGIAGISTAYFTLKHTTLPVVILEGGKLAHGATGHNAGQVVSYFERGFASLVHEFGLDKAAAGQKAIEGAWDLINEIYAEARLTIPFAQFLGHAGLTSKAQVLAHLENNHLRVRSGLAKERTLIREDAPFINDIPKLYHELFTLVPHAEILATLETENPVYQAVISYKKGVTNSALFCQEVVAWMQHTYPERFRLYEHTPVKKLVLHSDHALIDASTHTVRAERVVLCTNGFENFTIVDHNNLELDTRFHHEVRGYVGYMSGYFEPRNKEAIAISYLENPSADTSLSYFYLTRRPYEYELSQDHNLICIGGPGFDIEDTRSYRRDHEFPEDIVQEIDRFVKNTYDTDPNKTIDYKFTWHGLMGYTTNGVRMIGTEPSNPRLLYNLGCNGIGILPSVYGGKRIAQLINEEKLEASIFDVPTQTSLS